MICLSRIISVFILHGCCLRCLDCEWTVIFHQIWIFFWHFFYFSAYSVQLYFKILKIICNIFLKVFVDFYHLSHFGVLFLLSFLSLGYVLEFSASSHFNYFWLEAEVCDCYVTAYVDCPVFQSSSMLCFLLAKSLFIWE